MQQRVSVYGFACTAAAVIVIVTLLCPGSATAAASRIVTESQSEDEPLIDQIAMESIDTFSSPAENPQTPTASPPVSYTGFKINPNCKCGKSPYTNDGREANPHPWTAAVFYRNPPSSSPTSFDSMLLFCTGTLINDRYVLTASRCVQGLNATDLQVWLSEKSIWSDQRTALGRSGQRQYEDDVYLKKSPVEKVIIHPDFNPNTLDHEIALLRLADPVKFSRRRRDDGGGSSQKRKFFATPVCLPKYDVMEMMKMNDAYQEGQRKETPSYIGSVKGTIVSWDKKGRTSYSLVQTQVPFVNGIENCAMLTNKTAVLNENMLCAGKMEEGVKESCSMDTGSPLLFYDDGGDPDRHRVRLSAAAGSSDDEKGHYTLVGVSSWLYGCTNLNNVNVLYDVIFPNNTAKPQVPGVYARVEKYRDWITHNTLDSVWCA